MKTVITSALLLGMGLLLWLSLSEKTSTMLQRAIQQPDGIDAYMKNFEMRAMNLKGRPAMTLQAAELRHLANSDISEIDEPDIRLIDEQHQHWHITADRGTIDDMKQLITLRNNVKITRAENDTSPLLITSDAIDIDIDRQRITSDQQVYLEDGNTHLDSVGMILDNKAGTLRLLAEVRGQHVE